MNHGIRLHAIVLAGGTGRRLGGASKPDLLVGDRRLLDLTLGSLPPTTATVVVVAPPGVAVPDGTVRTLEDPPSGGPASGVAAGWHCLRAATDRHDLAEDDLVCLLACDSPDSGRAVPILTRALVGAHRSRGRAAGHDEVSLALVDGRVQFLPAVARARTLDHLCGEMGTERDVSMRRFLSPATWREVPVDAELLDDIDEWEDLRRFSDSRTGGA